MKVTDQVVGWLLIALGTVHCAFTPHPLTMAALWFLGGGLFLILVGAVNVMRALYGHGAAGLRWLSVVANFGALAFCGLIAYVSGRFAGPVAVSIILLVILTGFALAPQCEPAAKAQGAA